MEIAWYISTKVALLSINVCGSSFFELFGESEEMYAIYVCCYRHSSGATAQFMDVV